MDIDNMTAREIADAIEAADIWDIELCKRLADMADLSDEWEAGKCFREDVERIVTVAYKRLGFDEYVNAALDTEVAAIREPVTAEEIANALRERGVVNEDFIHALCILAGMEREWEDWKAVEDFDPKPIDPLANAAAEALGLPAIW